MSAYRFLILKLFLVYSLFDYVQSLITPVSIRNLNTVNDRISYYQFKFIYDQSIVDANAGFRITFPPEIPISLFEHKDLFECYFKVGYAQHDKVSCDYNLMQEVIIDVGTIIEGLQSISIGPIRNPPAIKGTAQFKLCVMYNDYA